MTREFFALTLLDPLLVSDESAKLYQALIKENQIASEVSGGFNYGLGNNFDYNGPMLHLPRRLSPRSQRRRRPEGGRQGDQRHSGARDHGGRAEAGKDQLPLF